MERKTSLQTLVEKIVEDKIAIGASALIYKGGKEALYAYAGRRDAERPEPFDRNTVMAMYSMTKVVTSVAIMTLMEKGILNPDTPVYDFIPEFRNLYVMREDGRTEPLEHPLTIYHLLTMTSGIPYPGGDHPVSKEYQKILASLSGIKKMSTLDFARSVAKCPIHFQPGEKWMYGLSADILGAVIVAATGMELGEYMKKAIFEKLGMNDTSFKPNENMEQRIATIYDADDENKIFTPRKKVIGFGDTDMSDVEMGGGGLFSTIDDFIKFGEMLRVGGMDVLRPSSIRQMSQNQLPLSFANEQSLGGYGYGYLVDTVVRPEKVSSGEAYGAFGWNGMAGTTFRIDPIRGLTIVFGIQRVPAEYHLYIPDMFKAIREDLGI